MHEIRYHKRQKLSERKVLRFTGFHSNVEKTFAIFASSVVKVLPLLKAFEGENFCSSSKICQNSCLAFIVYGKLQAS